MKSQVAVAVLLLTAAFGINATSYESKAGEDVVCSVTVHYNPRQPDDEPEITTTGRNSVSRCTNYTDRIALAAAVLRIVIGR